MPTTKFDWSSESAALTSDEYRLNIPVASLGYEAKNIAKFVRDHHKADKKTGLRGLGEAKIAIGIADEIESLVQAVSKAQTDYHMTVDPKVSVDKLDRARFIIDEIYAAVAFHLDDGVENDDDARFANIVAAHKDEPDTAANLALALEEYAGLAEAFAADIDGLGGFEMALTKEGRKLADELRLTGSSAPPSAASVAALGKRNRLLQLLDGRVRKVRAAAKFVFRDHADVARMIVSPYERKRRIDAKRAATRKKNAATTEPTPTPAAPAPTHA